MIKKKDLQDAHDAYERGDYKTAYKLFLLLAEQGDADAQKVLGDMYKQGQGVPQDYQEALKWYRLAAEQGFAKAQYNLGLMYADGLGVLQDHVSAYMWWNLAGSKGDKDAVTNKNTVEKDMTPQQIEEAQRLARNWKPKK